MMEYGDCRFALVVRKVSEGPVYMSPDNRLSTTQVLKCLQAQLSRVFPLLYIPEPFHDKLQIGRLDFAATRRGVIPSGGVRFRIGAGPDRNTVPW